MKTALYAAIASVLMFASTASAQVLIDAPVVRTSYYAPTITTAPTVSYYAPAATAAAPVTTYYAPAISTPVTSYYAPTTTSYYAPTTTSYYAPMTTSYYAPTTTYYAPTTTSYYAPTTTYYAPTLASSAVVVPRTTYYAPSSAYLGGGSIVTPTLYTSGRVGTDLFGNAQGYLPGQPLRNTLRFLAP